MLLATSRCFKEILCSAEFFVVLLAIGFVSQSIAVRSFYTDGDT